MFGDWDPVGDMQKGAKDFGENLQQGMNDAGNTIANVQNETNQGMQTAGENIQKGVGEFGKNAKKGVDDAKENVAKGVSDAQRALEEALRKLAEAIEGFVNSALLPGAAPKSKSPYQHVPGNTPHESILLSATLLGLDDGSVLRGLCQQTDGKWKRSEIDLNNHYESSGGTFNPGNGGFKTAGRNFVLEPSESRVMLKGELNDSGNWVGAEVDLSICVVVNDGGFAFEKHDGPWGRDGAIARHAEHIPVAGYIIAAIQSASDNQDHAQRALARCTSSTIVIIAAIAGAFLSGPLAAGVAAGISTPLAMLAESHIVKNIDDPRLRAKFEEATIGRAISEALKNSLAGAATGEAMEFVGEWLSQGFGTLVKKAIEMIAGALCGASLGLAKDVINQQASASEAAVMGLIGKVVEVLKGDDRPINEWARVRESIESKYGDV